MRCFSHCVRENRDAQKQRRVFSHVTQSTRAKRDSGRCCTVIVVPAIKFDSATKDQRHFVQPADGTPDGNDARRNFLRFCLGFF